MKLNEVKILSSASFVVEIMFVLGKKSYILRTPNGAPIGVFNADDLCKFFEELDLSLDK